MDRYNLDNQHKDALAEIGNISLGSAATALSQIVNRRVQITAPKVSLVSINDVRASFPKPCVVVTVKYIKGLDGENVFIVNNEDALFIVGMMMGMEPPEKPESLEEMELSAISEAMNQMMGSAATAMSDLFLRPVEISPPEVEYKDLQTEDIDLIDDNTPLIQVAFRMTINDFLDSELLQLIPIEHGTRVASGLLAGLSGEEIEQDSMENVPFKENPEDFLDAKAASSSFSVGQAAVQPEQSEQEDASGAAISSGPVEEETVFPDFLVSQKTILPSNGEGTEKIDLIRDIPIEISAVLGRKSLSLGKVFSLFPGEIITLEHQLGEPLGLYVNERLVARGEVVLINGQFGIKITEMIHSDLDKEK